MYYLYCNEFNSIRERTKHCASTKAEAQSIADSLNTQLDEQGCNGIWYYVRKFSPKGVNHDAQGNT